MTGYLSDLDHPAPIIWEPWQDGLANHIVMHVPSKDNKAKPCPTGVRPTTGVISAQLSIANS